MCCKSYVSAVFTVTLSGLRTPHGILHFCRSLPKIEELGDGTYHVSIWSETEPEIRLWAVHGLRFHEKFRTFWVENLFAANKPCCRMQPVDWFFLRHLCRHGSSTVQSILDALTEDSDFSGYDESYFPTSNAEDCLRRRINFALEEIRAEFDVSRKSGRFDLIFQTRSVLY
ncbi:MAG: hypothetical protein LBQ54_14360 [Planctomycetaceae bacterium]|nr:hypothetical protein [Planctomycetaceae bacterium]